MQTPKQMVILYEYMNVFRVIPLNAKHPDDMEPAYWAIRWGIGKATRWWWMSPVSTTRPGYSEPALFTPKHYTLRSGLHRVDKDQINYDVVMEDPDVLTKPWAYHSTMMLREGTRVREYVCAENNDEPEVYEKLKKDGVKFERQ